LNKDKLSLTASFMPALALAILMGFEYANENGYITVSPAVYALTEGAAFLFPFVIILMLMRGEERVHRRWKPYRMRYFTFIVLGSVALSFLSFLLNWAASIVFSNGYEVQQAISLDMPLWQLMLLSIFLPALCEELFFRGGLMASLEGSGFYSAMAASAIAFAFVHGDPSNMFGPLAAGLAYGYMTYITGSVWAAVTAHFINNSMSFGINYMLDRYSAVGLWQYFIIFVIVAFFIFLYLSMGRLERLIEKGKVPRIHRAGLSRGLSAIVFSPGLWLLLVMFIFRSIYFGA